MQRNSRPIFNFHCDHFAWFVKDYSYIWLAWIRQEMETILYAVSRSCVVLRLGLFMEISFYVSKIMLEVFACCKDVQLCVMNIPWTLGFLSLSLIQSVPLFTPFFPPCATFHWVTKASRWLVLNGRISSSNHFSSSSSFPFTLSARKKFLPHGEKKRNPDCQQNNKLVFIRALW